MSRRKRGQNEGSIYKMADGRWRAAVSVGWRGGKRVRKTFTGKKPVPRSQRSSQMRSRANSAVYRSNRIGRKSDSF